METNSQGVRTATNVAAAALLSVLIFADAIKQGYFLVGRYNAISGDLTDVHIAKTRDQVPPNTEHSKYSLIGIGDNSLAGMPLDEFVETNCEGWDGVTPITLYFDRAQGTLTKWEETPQAAAAGS